MERVAEDDSARSEGRKSPFPQSYSVSRQGSRSNLRANYANEPEVNDDAGMEAFAFDTAPTKATSVTSEALSFLAASQGDGVVADSTSDISARSDINEAAMSPRSELSSITTGFDSRSEVSAASHEPLPGTPRTDISDIPSILVDPVPDEVTATPTKLLLSSRESSTSVEEWEAPTPLAQSLLVFPEQAVEDTEEENVHSRDVTASPLFRNIQDSSEDSVEHTELSPSDEVFNSEDMSGYLVSY